jgi:hypothetical protein
MTTDAARKEDARSVSRWGGHASSRVLKSTHPPRPERRPNGIYFTFNPTTSRRVLPGPTGTTGSQALDAALALPYQEGGPGCTGADARGGNSCLQPAKLRQVRILSTILLTFDTMTIASAAHGMRVSNLVLCVKLSIMVSKAGIPSGS